MVFLSRHGSKDEGTRMMPCSDYISNPVCMDQFHFSQEEYADGQIKMKGVKGPPKQKQANKINVPEPSTHDHPNDKRENISSSSLATRKIRNKSHNDEPSLERISRDTKLEDVLSRKTAEACFKAIADGSSPTGDQVRHRGLSMSEQEEMKHLKEDQGSMISMQEMESSSTFDDSFGVIVYSPSSNANART
jgi:hypothetical protein